MEYRDVTILYVQDDQSWCDYVLRHFRNDEIKMRLETLKVDTLLYENPPELEAAIRESHVLVFLTTSNFLNYMEDSREWLTSMMRKSDPQLSTSNFALLDITPEDMMEFCEQNKYPYDTTKCIEIYVDGSNISNVIVHIIELVEKYAEKRAAHDEEQAKQTLPRKRSSNVNNPLDIVPSRLPQPGEEVALLFHTEVRGKVTVNFNHIKEDIECRTVNPYCAVFIVPEVPGKTVTLRINIDGVRYSRRKVEKAKTCEFSSVEFLCQAYGAASKEELDSTLASTFSRSLCSDPVAIRMYEEIMENPKSHGHNNNYPTMLHWAAANGMKELSSALLSAPGAALACETNNIDGHDPTDLARRNEYPELADLLDEFIDAQQLADTCDLYVQCCGQAGAIESPVNYETMDSPGVFSQMPYSSMSPLKKSTRGGSLDSAMPSLPSLPEGPPPVLPPRPSARDVPPSTSAPSYLPSARDFLNMPTPQIPTARGAVGSRSQTELVEIQEEVKKGNINLNEAQMLFKSWKERNATGAAVSFKERQQAIEAFQIEHKNVMETLRTIKNCKKGEKRTVASGLAPLAMNISEPILKRQTLGSGKRLGGNNIGSNASTNSNVSCDSGRDSTLSQASSSSDDVEYSQPVEPCGVMERSASCLRRDSDTPRPEGLVKKMNNRVSYSELYLELTEEPSQQEGKAFPPPPPIPARTRSLTAKSTPAKPITTKPKVAVRPTIATSPASTSSVISSDTPPEPSPTSLTPKTRVYSKKGSHNAPIVAPKPRSK